MLLDYAHRAKSYIISIILIALLLPCHVLAEILPKPEFFEYVYDYANVINEADEELIKIYANSVNAMGAGVIVTLTVESLNGMDAQNYGEELFNTWGIGSSETNDGLLILLAPNERRIQMITGLGIEFQMTEDICGEIIDTYAIDKLAANQFSAGMRDIVKATCVKMALMRSQLFDDFQFISSVQAL